MRRTLALATCALLLLPVAACGKDSSTSSPTASKGGPGFPGAPAAAPTLSKDQLESAFIAPADLPESGWSRNTKDEADESASASSSLTASATSTKDAQPCGMGDDPDAPKEVYSGNRAFEKGSGMGASLLRISINQFAGEAEAKDSYSRGFKRLAECHEWKDPESGSSVTISDMSADKIGDESDAKKMQMTSSGMPITVEFRYARVGSTIMTIMDMGVTSTPTEAGSAAATKQADKLKATLAAAK